MNIDIFKCACIIVAQLLSNAVSTLQKLNFYQGLDEDFVSLKWGF